MSQKLKSLYILCGVFLVITTVVVLLIVFTNGDEPLPSNPVSDIDVHTVNTEDITDIKVENESGEFHLVHGDEKFLIKGREDVDIIDYKLTEIAENIADIKAMKIINDGLENKDEYGLLQPHSTISVTLKDGSAYTVYIGDEAVGGGFYMYTSMTEHIYTYDQYVANAFLQTRMELYTVGYIAQGLSLENFSSFIITSGNDTIASIRKRPAPEDGTENLNDYEMIAPLRRNGNINTIEGTDASPGLITKFAAVIPNEAVCDDVNNDTLKEYYLKTPAYTLNVRYEDKNVNIELSEKIDNEYYYVRLKDGKIIFKMDAAVIEFIENNTVYFMERNLYLREIGLLSGLNVNIEGKEYDFRIGNSDSENVVDMTVIYNGESMFQNEFRRLYMILVTTEFNNIGGTITGQPYLTVRYDLKRGTSDTIKFYKINDTTVCADINGREQYTLLKVDVDFFITNCIKYVNKQSVDQVGIK